MYYEFHKIIQLLILIWTTADIYNNNSLFETFFKP